MWQIEEATPDPVAKLFALGSKLRWLYDLSRKYAPYLLGETSENTTLANDPEFLRMVVSSTLVL